jgi:hypothetical protein
VIRQHQGGGKAKQYFLRGLDADHGTDVALFVDGWLARAGDVTMSRGGYTLFDATVRYRYRMLEALVSDR